MDHPIARDQRQFEERYCQGHWREKGGQQRWQASGATQLDELRRLTRPLILHRRKAQVLELPPKQRREHPIALSDAESLGFDHRIDLVVEDFRRRARNGEVRSDAEPLAVLTALRRIAAEFKLPAAARLVRTLLDAGEAVVLFSGFVEPLQLLEQRLGGALLTGRQRSSERQQAVDRFQKGDVDLLLATFGTGALGFRSSGQARGAVGATWTPGDLAQAVVPSPGMADAVLTCHWLQLGPADQLVDGLVASKAERIEILLGPRRVMLDRQSLPAMLRRCLQVA